MKFFGFEIKIQRSVIKKMLREKGSIDTRRFLKKEWGWHEFDASQYTFNLIQRGCMDLDLYRLYKIKGPFGLGKVLIKDYKLNQKKFKKYLSKIQKVCKIKFYNS